jgi:hypothetical protein
MARALRILVTKAENIKPAELIDAERLLLKQRISGARLKVFPWPDKPKDIPDSEELKLVITREKNDVFMHNVIGTKGESSTRTSPNPILFLMYSSLTL